MSPDNHKKNEEKLLLRHFKEIYYNFPKGKLIATESPDFILKPGPQHAIGMELMRLHKDKTDTDAFAPRSTEYLKRELIQETKLRFEQQSAIKCYTVLYFTPDFKLFKNQLIPLSKSLSQLISDKIKKRDKRSPFQETINNTKHSDVIQSIRLLYHPAVPYSYWTSGETFLTSSLTRELFIRHIREKEEKMELYKQKKLDQYWLILLTDFATRSTSFNLHNKLSLWSFRSTFHKVFLFEIFNPGIYELK
jgi:hypothetical protein